MKRPLGMAYFAALAIIVGIAQVVASLGYFGIEALQVRVLMGEFGNLTSAQMYGYGSALALFGVAGVIVGVSALAMRSWAWLTGMLLFGIEVIGALVMLATAQASVSSAVTGIAGAVLFWYLSTTDVREAFGQETGVTGGHHPSAA